MENIRFIREITTWIYKPKREMGNCIYYEIPGGTTLAKVWCESTAVVVRILDKKSGLVDEVVLPFANYFRSVCCSDGGPFWYQYITNGDWNFSGYPHVLPTDEDYQRIAQAIYDYMYMFI